MRLSVIGLGKLGAPLAAVLADRGFGVIGVDRNPEAVNALQSGRAPVSEPGLQDLLDQLPEPIAATTDLRAAVLGTDATFIVVPTPSQSDGTFSAAAVTDAIGGIGAALRHKDTFHLVVISSTVMPGTTGGIVRQVLEESAGRPLGERLGLCYSPEFIALGSVIHNLRQPDFILIGESDEHAGTQLERICQARCNRQPVIRRMNFANAELAKIAVNGMVTARISWANMLSEMCDRLTGADAAVVAAAVGSDSRIGSKYLFPALGYGGPCFPRDNMALEACARSLGVGAELAEATDRINRRQAGRVVSLVRQLLPGGTVGVLGLAYKPDTNLTVESQGVAIASLLAEAGYRVLVADPAAEVSDPRMKQVPDAECAAQADLLIIATPWPAFRDLPLPTLRRNHRKLPVIDCWRLLPANVFAGEVDLFYLGDASRGG